MSGVQGSERANMEAVGLQVDGICDLADCLKADFSATLGGFALFRDDPDERRRALRADETTRASWAVAQNLMEARLHERDLSAAIGDGLRAAGAGSEASDYLALTEVDRHIAGFFRAFGSVLDTLAALAIGVLRVPRSITRADFTDLLDLADSHGEVPPDQQAAWVEFQSLVEAHRGMGPIGWMDFALEYRNSVVHRARQLSMGFQVPTPRSDLVVVTDDPIGVALRRARFQRHLRRRPWVPDLDDLIDNDRLDGVWLSEPASVTLAGLRQALNGLVDEACRRLLSYWQPANDGRLDLVYLPDRRRRPRGPKALSPEFSGFAPGPPMQGELLAVSGGLQAERSRLARRIRDTLPGSD